MKHFQGASWTLNFFVRQPVTRALLPIIGMSAAEISLVAKTFRMRLRSNPALGVADLMKPFEKLFGHHGSRDLRKLLDPPLDMDWKSSPHVKWLVKHKILFDAFLDVAPNTSITSRKLKDALQRLHEKEPIHSSKKDDGALWDFFDTKIRIGLAQLRELKHNRDLCLDRGMKKLSADEQQVLELLLAKIHFQKEDMLMMVGSSTTPPATSSNGDSQELEGASSNTPHEDHAIVAVPPPPVSAEKASAMMTPSTKSPKDAQDIFANILQRKGIEDTPKKKKKPLKECTSSDPSTPDTLSLISAKKKLRFDDDSDYEQDLGDGPSSSRTPATITILPKGKEIMKDNMNKKAKDRGEKAASSSKGVVKGKKSSYTSGKKVSTSFFDGMLDNMIEDSGEEGDPVDDDDDDDVVASAVGGNKLSSAFQGKKGGTKKPVKEGGDQGGAHAKTADRKKTPSSFEFIDAASRLLYQGCTTFADCC